jgi:hypothetical protein
MMNLLKKIESRIFTKQYALLKIYINVFLYAIAFVLCREGAFIFMLGTLYQILKYILISYREQKMVK